MVAIANVYATCLISSSKSCVKNLWDKILWKILLTWDSEGKVKLIITNLVWIRREISLRPPPGGPIDDINWTSSIFLNI